jgi:DeoR family transcriptional regulator, aga operon transcriptional repressor
MIGRAHRVVVVADSSKIGQVVFARICDIADVGELVTDHGADPADVAALEHAGLRVVLAPGKQDGQWPT